MKSKKNCSNFTQLVFLGLCCTGIAQPAELPSVAVMDLKVLENLKAKGLFDEWRTSITAELSQDTQVRVTQSLVAPTTKSDCNSCA